MEKLLFHLTLCTTMLYCKQAYMALGHWMDILGYFYQVHRDIRLHIQRYMVKHSLTSVYGGFQFYHSFGQRFSVKVKSCTSQDITKVEGELHWGDEVINSTHFHIQRRRGTIYSDSTTQQVF